ncbi:transcriptional pleiotropic regulator of transition state genes [Halanaerobium saccharolyticum]|uniref:Transcriptional pleiotropic regulator of transition state genes n=1 Tax=Halanaerobium saccharolyticum TaxID=43595 RepID=A0A2T5RGW0_9FIRM|nr:transcriptional pleiotropic regulator of transition state genes [Halanaerobium saccharolyticum]
MITIKSTGIVRKIDDLGRMVIPIELRKTLNISKKDPMEVFVDGNKIILQKYEPGCEYCGSMDNLIEFEDRHICTDCVNKMKEKIEE